MNRLLKIEITKLLSYNTFWVLTGIAGGFYVLILGAITQINFNVAEIDPQIYWRFPVVWQSISYYSSWFNLLLALLIIILTANDFVFRTLRQHVIDGLSRQDIFVSKLALMLVFAGIAFGVNLLAGFFIGSIFSKGYQDIFKDIYFIFLYFINVMGIMSFAYFIAVAMKKTGISIVLFAGVYIFELILRGYLALLNLNFGQFLPFKVFSNLCTAPSLKKMIADPMIKQSLEQSIQLQSKQGTPLELNTLLAIAYTGLFLYLSYYLLQKRDL